MRKERTYETAKEPIYGNWKVFHPNDKSLMFFCNQKKANWYLKRNLAKIINEKEIQLTFIPKGKGCAFDLYGKSSKENICVVCGEKEELTKHHIVPKCYRKHFPDEYKSRNSHDIVSICAKHHREYEVLSDKLKVVISKQYGEMMHQIIPKDILEESRVGGALVCLMKRKEMLPKEKVEVLENKIKTYFEITDLPSNLNELFEKVKNLKENYLNKLPSKFKIIVSKIENLQEFVEMWREHFMVNMNPQYMPLGWNIKRSAKRKEQLT